MLPPYFMRCLAHVLAGASVWCLASAVFAAADGGPAASWRQQVEADWLRQDAKRLSSATVGKVTCQEDAAGAVDGIKNGLWGFHTAQQKDPWWQVDLGQSVPLDRVLLYNRCDGGFAARNARVKVLASADGKEFRQVYQHDGTVFHGFTDQKPLVVKLKGLQAQFLRLALDGTSYFHLDEVEVYRQGSARNIALHQPASQSSVSEWSARSPALAKSAATAYPLDWVLQRGMQLATSQGRLGAEVTSATTRLRALTEEARRLPPDASDAVRRELYLRAHWAVRSLALANPLLNFDSVLFVKRAPSIFPHMSDQHYGWWSRPGGGICRLENFKSDSPQLRCLTSDLPPGNFVGPEVSYDGQRVLFAYCHYHPEVADLEKVDKSKLPEDTFYKIYEMKVDGSERRQITFGRYDDFDARYLPNGDIVFLSTRKGLPLQCTSLASDATRLSDLPDSYVRCGGDSHRPVPVFTLHLMDAAGHNIRPFSAFENFEWSPSVANDGRILYTRWDYIDRFNGHFFSLWSANQDGGNPQLAYGNYTVKPQVVLEARSIPGSSKLVFTACAHHSITGGSLCLLDRSQGLEDQAPLTRLTPEVCFPETEGSPTHYYAYPWPLSEEYFLVGWADAKLPPHTRVSDQRNPANAMGIYLYDAFGNLELLHRDPEISSAYPMPVAARLRPPTQSGATDWNGPQEGRYLVQDIYRGLENIRRGSIKALRLVAVPPKVQPYMNNPVLGVSAEDPGKYVLGTVPVEADGSAYFRVPSGVPLFFQALDEQGMAVQTMRSLAYVQPGQSLACVGCHEHRDSAPPSGHAMMASAREPSRLSPGPEGSWPLRYDRLVQPVLDRLCVNCHRPGSDDAAAAKLDLTPPASYKSLLSIGNEDLKKAAFERDRSVAGYGTTATSKLWSLLNQEGGHRQVKLDADSRNRLITWMDTYAQRVGHFSEAQEKQLETFRASLSDLLAGPAPTIQK